MEKEITEGQRPELVDGQLVIKKVMALNLLIINYFRALSPFCPFIKQRHNLP
jgi:hypothetical protein